MVNVGRSSWFNVGRSSVKTFLHYLHTNQLEIQPTFSHLNSNSSMVRVFLRRSKGCGFESRRFGELGIFKSKSKNNSKKIVITIFKSEFKKSLKGRDTLDAKD